jgi:hypothetical protein
LGDKQEISEENDPNLPKKTNQKAISCLETGKNLTETFDSYFP